MLKAATDLCLLCPSVLNLKPVDSHPDKRAGQQPAPSINCAEESAWLASMCVGDDLNCKLPHINPTSGAPSTLIHSRQRVGNTNIQ